MTKRAFPALDKFCHDRNVFFSPVDLRWGITAEQAEDGKVIQLCLGEVDRSRPYFVGMLGDRYGWHINPDIGDARLEETFKFAEQFYPWLKNHRSSSVTELEVLHGALNAPKEHHSRIFFYLRTQIPPNAPEEDLDSYRSESAYAAERLKILKDRIRSSGLKYFEYSDITAMGDQLLADLQAAIEADFPSNNALSPLVKERLENHAFAETRARVYVGGYDSFKRLDEYVDSFVKEPLVVLGESGSGKSSLMANWSIKYEEKHADQLMITHYIGATPSSSYHYSLLRRVMAEIKEYLDLPDEVPTDMDELVPQFPIWFEKVCPAGDFPAEPPEPPKKERSDKAEEIDPEFVAKEEACRQQYLSKHIKPRMVLVLDAINQLENRDNAHDLTWLPKVFPRAVRVIISTLPGRCLDVLQGRKWPTWTVTGLKSGDKREIMDKYLQLYSKTLSEQQADAISENSNTDNPLFLRTLLNELRIIGNFENLDIQIGQYLSADGPAGLYELVLTRWEEDYGGPVVADVMATIWVSSQGVSDIELLGILSIGRHALSPIMIAGDEVFVVRTGLMGFFHDHLRSAVHRRYLSTEESVAKYRSKMADYFFNQRDWASPRACAELPYQLELLGDLERLTKVISDISVFHILNSPMRRLDLARYWRQIGLDKAKEIYTKSLLDIFTDNPPSEKQHEYIEELTLLGDFLHAVGQYQDSCSVYERAVALAEKKYGKENYQLAKILIHHCEALGKFGAVRSPTLQRAIGLIEKEKGVDSTELVHPLIEMAIIFSGKDTTRAHEIIDRACRIASSSVEFQQKQPEHYCNTIRTKARVYWKEQKWVPAILNYRRALAESELRLGPLHEFTASVLNALGLCLQKKWRT
eukprot:TRINITY_DN261_c0_g1_i6.p1 TRINITY_DN261_c0_g1~~TRINITY_DN261_c0_g1_i6.p1  ORF type:complete len:918 (-),score=235.13 TRINITY_DN261_c0_g1_i6:357-2960(-)